MLKNVNNQKLTTADVLKMLKDVNVDAEIISTITPLIDKLIRDTYFDFSIGKLAIIAAYWKGKKHQATNDFSIIDAAIRNTEIALNPTDWHEHKFSFGGNVWYYRISNKL